MQSEIRALAECLLFVSPQTQEAIDLSDTESVNGEMLTSLDIKKVCLDALKNDYQEEKRQILERITEYLPQNTTEMQNSSQYSSQQISNGKSTTKHSDSKANSTENASASKRLKTLFDAEKKSASAQSSAGNTPTTAQKRPLALERLLSSYKKSASIEKTQEPTQKPKRIRALPTDAEGNLILPVVLGRSTSRVSVYCIGNVDSKNDVLHDENFIYPIGFTSKRRFTSFADPKKRIIYTCRISHEPGQQVEFSIQPHTAGVYTKVTGSTIKELWTNFRTKFEEYGTLEGIFTFETPQEFFGLDHDGVRKQIQDQAESANCARYHPVYWIVKPQKGRRSPVSADALSSCPPSALSSDVFVGGGCGGGDGDAMFDSKDSLGQSDFEGDEEADDDGDDDEPCSILSDSAINFPSSLHAE